MILMKYNDVLKQLLPVLTNNIVLQFLNNNTDPVF
jgi:hypothetical protein